MLTTVGYAVVGLVVVLDLILFGTQIAGAMEPCILTDIMVLPLSAAFIIMALPDRHWKLIKWIGAAFSFVTMILSMYVAWSYFANLESGALYRFNEAMPWIPSLGIN